MFRRTAADGEACTPLNDGFGGLYYGTCDPTITFCCIEEEAGCGTPSPSDEGTCQPVAGIGDVCSVFPVQLCATGVMCSAENRCEEASTAILAPGVECAGESFGVLGECQDSWCDLIDTGLCEPLSDDGTACVFPYECVSGACNAGVCSPFATCVGTWPGCLIVLDSEALEAEASPKSVTERACRRTRQYVERSRPSRRRNRPELRRRSPRSVRYPG